MFQKLKHLVRKSFSNSTLPHSSKQPAEHQRYQELVVDINQYLKKNAPEAVRYKDEMVFLNSDFNPLPGVEKIYYAVIPYSFVLDYDYRKVIVHKDEVADMLYVYLDGKKMYYHKGFKTEEVQKSFTYLCIEQHLQSPHRYLTEEFIINENDVVADIGAAEGNFSLMVVDKVKELILVEGESIWIEALQKTFEPWKEKVRIINKFAGSENNSNTITLDALEKQHPLTAMKMDIEGAELEVLNGAAAYLQNKNLKMAITTYHKQTDALNIQKLLTGAGYQTVFSKGYMLFVNDTLHPPFFRHGLIKAKK
jgi:23S rRNA U2552 (ribose-2'-O)-methylase RlmE/FtsJ